MILGPTKCNVLKPLINCTNICNANKNSFILGLGPSKSYCLMAGMILCLELEDIANELILLGWNEVRINYQAEFIKLVNFERTILTLS